MKYNKPNGSIQIELDDFEDYVTIQFIDTGIGIKEEELPQLFERFYRVDTARTEEGTGLGLAIVKQIVDLHDGSITVKSKFEEGTSFLVTLPKLRAV
ncbi:Sensor protein SrrB [compost metagenome]